MAWEYSAAGVQRRSNPPNTDFSLPRGSTMPVATWRLPAYNSSEGLHGSSTNVMVSVCLQDSGK